MILHHDIERLYIAIGRLQEECIRAEYRHRELMKDLALINGMSQKILSHLRRPSLGPPAEPKPSMISVISALPWIRISAIIGLIGLQYPLKDLLLFLAK